MFYADLHIHSKYSRACSKDGDLEHLAWWARRKGVAVLGTGDFTHPAWFDHLRDLLEPAEPGLFRLRAELDRQVVRTLPPSCRSKVRFMLSVEISTIYKRDERTRKVHHLVYVPDFDTAAEFNRRLARIGNLGSDGRPILGLDSRDLLEITLESGAGAYLVPAHVWTPWFAVLGSKSGFDAVHECYADLAEHIFALETGLSSDPAMNWRVSALDRYRLVSNSDAHSPPIIGREATVFDTNVDYFAIRRALQTGAGLAGTIEFFPEEGKYHLDGHRKCNLRLEPAETRAAGGRCPTCGKPVTVGVLHRVEELADRIRCVRPTGAAPFRGLVQLPQVMGEILGVGSRSKNVYGEIAALTAALGPELYILDTMPLGEIEVRSPVLAEAVRRLRSGEVAREAGYDGEYGIIRVFQPGELDHERAGTTDVLFHGPIPTPRTLPRRDPTLDRRQAGPRNTGIHRGHRQEGSDSDPAQPVVSGEDGGNLSELAVITEIGPVSVEEPIIMGSERLDPEQRAAVQAAPGPVLIVAGPGTGKTRTLTHRIAHHVRAGIVEPEQCLAITFTRRAAAEMADRLGRLLADGASRATVTTFHAIGLRILREHHDRLGLTADFGIATEAQRLDILTDFIGERRAARTVLADLSAARRGGVGSDGFHERYVGALRERDLVDFDDLVVEPVVMLDADPTLVADYRRRFQLIAVDEYQDVDVTQYRLLRHLAPRDGNLTVIGDPDQSIYRFRGADVGFFLSFKQDYPTATVVELSCNYRSTAPIVGGALQAIAPASLVPNRRLTPAPSVHGGHRGETSGTELPAPIGLHHASDEHAEGSFVARTIDQLLGGSSFHSLDSGRVDGFGSDSLSLADIAVLYRTDAQATPVMEGLTRAGIPFQKRSHDRLAVRPGVQEIVHELKYRTARADQAEYAGGLKTSPSWAVEALFPEPPALVADRVKTAAAAILARRSTTRLRAPTAVSNTIASGLLEPKVQPSAPEDAHTREAEIHTAVELLMPLAMRCGDDVERFLAELALGAEVDTWDPRADLVSLLTLHASKGLEFPVVFIVGCDDGLLPLRPAGVTGGPLTVDEIAEERRLFFVGMTRARRRLFLSHAAERTRRGATHPASPSPFLATIATALIERIGATMPRPRRQATQLRLM